MKQKGFTLIELLAVIVILAIIAIIAVPMVLDVVKKAETGATKNTAYGLMKAAETKYAEDKIFGSTESVVVYSYTAGVQSSSNGEMLEYKGDGIESGTISVDKEGRTSVYLHDGTNCFSKSFTDEDVTVTEDIASNCVFTPLTEIEVLVVAGGGSGGSHSSSTSTGGSGGGAGGLIFDNAYTVSPGASLSVEVGNGGLATNAGGNPGEDSIFGTITTIGGGRGTGNGQTSGPDGGSGAGDSYYASSGGVNFGTGVAGQGNDGGSTETHPSPYPSGGGGGAGAKGEDATATKSGNGGAGLYYGDLFGDNYGASGYFAAGGGGGIGNGGIIANRGTGIHGSGDGGYDSEDGTSALAATGSGGGGSSRYGSSGGNGGSGIVLVRYLGAPRATGGTITHFNGYTVHTFTEGTGSFKPLNY